MLDHDAITSWMVGVVKSVLMRMGGSWAISVIDMLFE